MLPVSYFLFTFHGAQLIINADFLLQLNLLTWTFLSSLFKDSVVELHHADMSSKIQLYGWCWYRWDYSWISNPALTDVGIAGFSPSAMIQVIAAAPADTCPISIPLWYLKDLYSSGKILQKILFYSWRERSRFWRWVLFQICFFCSLAIVDSSVLERVLGMNKIK